MFNVLRDVAKTVRKIVISHAYYGLFLSTINRKEVPDLEPATAAVALNNINVQLLIHPGFWEGLTPNEKQGIILHEAMHLCFFHLTEGQNYTDRKLFNIAAD